MADNYLEKRYDEVFGSGSGQETVAVHGNLLIRKRGGKIVSVRRIEPREAKIEGEAKMEKVEKVAKTEKLKGEAKMEKAEKVRKMKGTE